MPPRRILNPAPLFDRALFLQALEAAGVKTIHAQKLWSQAIRRPSEDLLSIPDLPRAAACLLQGERPMFARLTSRVDAAQTSADGLTTKLKIRLQDGLAVETVIMRWDPEAAAPAGSGEDDGSDSQSLAGGRNPSDRSTVCVSSQVGCQMGCTFCATGTMGLKGNLTAGEIVEQLLHAKQYAPRVRNVVFMGMGEPMSNWKAVTEAVRAMVDPKLFGLSPRHVTVSTVGVVPRIRSMHDDLPGVRLALSLHAPSQELRQTIVPSARAYQLPKLMDAVDEYQRASKQKVFVEYVLLEGVNDGLLEAEQLGQLLQGRDVTLNLIPWNPVHSPASSEFGFGAPSPEAVSAFQRCLREKYGVFTTVRQEKGQDISGACGQLVLQASGAQGPASPATAMPAVRDIEELASC